MNPSFTLAMHANLIQKQQIENATFRKLTRKARKMAKHSAPSSTVSMSTRLNSNAKHAKTSNTSFDKTPETSFESFSRVSAKMNTEVKDYSHRNDAFRMPSATFSNNARNFLLNCSVPISWQSSASSGVSPYQASLVQDKATRLYQPNDIFMAFLMGAAAAQLNPPSGLQIDSRTCSLSGRLA